jgi:hypothetical protein
LELLTLHKEGLIYLRGNQPENELATKDGVVVNIAKYKIAQVEKMNTRRLLT